MNKIERKILEWIEGKKEFIFFVVISLLGLVIRTWGINSISGDMEGCLLPWYSAIKSGGGFGALGKQVGDYGFPYQLIIAVMTYIPINPVYLYKSLSILFDYVLSFVCAQFVCMIKKEKSDYLFCMVYSIVLLLPTVVMNSSIWGQCDSMYTAFILIGLCFLWKERYKTAFIYFGLAFSFKLQTVFIIPFLLYYYVRQKKFSIFCFFLIPIVDYILYIPSFVMGRSLLEPVKIYLGQTGEYPNMWYNFPSFWALLGNDQLQFKFISLILTISALGIGMLFIMHSKINLRLPFEFMTVLVWSVWTCLLFLPSMHERYGYMLDIFLICLVMIKGEKYMRYAVTTFLCSFVTYGNYLFGLGINIRLLSVFYTVAYLHYIYFLLSEIKRNGQPA